MTDAEYDVILVGAGAGGGVAAAVLTEAGLSVLLLERGRSLSHADVPADHLRHQRVSRYGHNAGPDIEGHPRVVLDPQQRRRVVRPHEPSYQNNAACVGGGTRVYGGMAWRFLPDDFRMASRYGVPDGSSLADWPMDYDELEPWYDRAEWALGVAGDGEGNQHQGPRRRGYPLPPLPANPERAVLQRGAERLGLNTFPVPLLINSTAYNGRGACQQCGMCVGFACPSDAKNGTQNTLIPRALASGRCRLLEQAVVERIETDGRGRAVGVSYWHEGQRKLVQARAVACAGGAVETARLLLNSASDREPRGLGNRHDQVGRHLQGHYYTAAHGLIDEPVHSGRGPGPSIATCAFNHGTPGVIGGGMIANEFVHVPVFFMQASLPPGMRRWGQEAKRYMRRAYARTVDLKCPTQEIPSPDARVTVDARVRDRWGIPVACLSGTTHPESVRTAEAMRRHAERWLHASGAKPVWSEPLSLRLSGGQHQAGTCRMGEDPRTSVTDRWGRVHGHDNLFVLDGSVHVTNGGFNPVLTIMALAWRNADHLARSL
ncbi:MAG: GMC family oxidoreductase [Phycisphaeraceae bacterium]